MFEKPLISIIVPMYNSEKTIRNCINSLVQQSLRNIEIIIVDDASTDHSVNIAKEYCNKYSYIHLIENPENKGGGSAKNIGMANAQSDIIGFCDADDYVDSNYYEILYNNLIKFDADIACCDIALVYENHTDYLKILDNNIYYELSSLNANYGDQECPVFITSEIAAAHCVSASATTKLFRSKVIGNFFEGTCDDLMFTYPGLLKANKIIYVPNNFYYYVQTNNSLERSKFNEKRLNLSDCLTETVNELSQSGKNYIEMAKIIYAYSSWTIILDILQKKEKREEYIKYYYQNLQYRYFLSENIYLKQLIINRSIGEQFFLLDLIDLFIKGKFEKVFDLYDKYNFCPELYLPKVSIIIPVYNGSNFLEEAIQSALVQNYPNFEIIVVNDGSTDDKKTEKIAKRYGNRIRYFYKENGGVASALNYGIDKMTGEYFSWLSHDDLYTEGKLLKQIEALQTCLDKKTIVVSGYTLINERKEKMYDISPLTQYTKEQLESPLFAVFRGCINGCAMLIHKSHFERVGKFDVNLPTTQDYELWFRMMRNQKICFIPGNYVLSRSHDSQDSKKLYRKHIEECNKLWISLFECITSKEINELAKDKYTFWEEERVFFRQTPYDKVNIYLDLKLLEFLLQSWIHKENGVIEKLSLLFKFPEQIIKNELLIQMSKLPEPKIAIIFPEHYYQNNNFKLSLEAICNNKNNINYIFIKLSEINYFECMIDEHCEITFPMSEISILPHTIKLINCDTVLISDDFCCLENSLCSKCNIMKMRVISWNFNKHWLLSEKQTLLEKEKYIVENKYVSLTVWTDRMSANIEQIKNNFSMYIPLVDNISQISDVSKMWNNAFAEKTDDFCFMDTDLILSKLIDKIENATLWQIDHTEIKIETIKKIVTLPNEDSYWKENYMNILNSTSWKITKPLRYFVDIFKNLLSYKKG